MAAVDKQFIYDVFLSHSSKDKPVVQELAERLKKDGLKVWFDDWEIKPGESIPAKIEEGLENSRILLLFMSVNSFGSDWAQLEMGTFRFRDPLNKDRRFIPLRLDDSDIKGSLSQFLYLNWFPEDREKNYAKILEACLPHQKHVEVEYRPQLSKKANNKGAIFRKLEGHRGPILAAAFTKDGKFLVTGSSDESIIIWDAVKWRPTKRLGSYRGPVRHIKIGLDNRIYSASDGGGIMVWDLRTGQVINSMWRNQESISGLTITPNGEYLISCSVDRQISIWDLHHMQIVQRERDLESSVSSVVAMPDNRSIIIGQKSGLILQIDLRSGKIIHLIGKHSSSISGLAVSHNGSRVLSGAGDTTVRIWNFGKKRAVLEGHKGRVSSVAITKNGSLGVSGSWDKTIRIWDLNTGTCLESIFLGSRVECVSISDDGKRVVAGAGDTVGYLNVLENKYNRFSDRGQYKSKTQKFPLISDQVKYANAKVLLVGETGVGKTGLFNYLSSGHKVEENKPLPSTDGAWATHLKLKNSPQKDNNDQEIWLWDFAGQIDYRLIHQLFMDDTAAAVLVFNPQTENPIEELGNWVKTLQKGTERPFAKLIAAGRIDRGGLIISEEKLNKFISEHGFNAPFYITSAKTGEGCEQLREAIINAIDWQSIPTTTSPALYHQLKKEIMHLRDTGLILIRLAELKQRMEIMLKGRTFEPQELDTVISLLAGPGMIQRLEFGGFVLLKPEVLSRYAAALVRKLRKHPQGLGCIREDDLLNGDLDYQDFERLSHEDEAVILRALHETLISRAWCLRQPCDTSTTSLLTFPSYFRRERKEQLNHPNILVTYRFDGPTDDIYATLTVRLHYTIAFESTELWRSAADFKTQTGAALGFSLIRENEGTSRLEIYFEDDVDPNSRVLFLRYIHDHLMQFAHNVKRLRHYSCMNKKCQAFGQVCPQIMIDKAIDLGNRKVFCPYCGKPVLLRDIIEEKFESPSIKKHVQVMQDKGQIIIDNESRELLAVHHTGFIVAEAGQIYRGYTNSDWGIDGEIEFKDLRGNASGKRLYLQLKSGDSYLKKRKPDGTEVFQIKNPRWVEYWTKQAYTVMLVIRTSDGEIRWMDVSSYLNRSKTTARTTKQIVFDGEQFNVMSIIGWRDKLLSSN